MPLQLLKRSDKPPSDFSRAMPKSVKPASDCLTALKREAVFAKDLGAKFSAVASLSSMVSTLKDIEALEIVVFDSTDRTARLIAVDRIVQAGDVIALLHILKFSDDPEVTIAATAALARPLTNGMNSSGKKIKNRRSNSEFLRIVARLRELKEIDHTMTSATLAQIISDEFPKPDGSPVTAIYIDCILCNHVYLSAPHLKIKSKTLATSSNKP